MADDTFDDVALGELCGKCEPPLQAGSCVLGRPEVAAIVQGALRHFEGVRYSLVCWCIMPNHVHVVLTPSMRHVLSDILHSWKSFTSKEVNRLLGRTGTLWERESFDHLIRSEREFERLVEYVEQNPVAAGLCERPEEWAFSSCGAGFQPARVSLIDPRTLPFVEPRSRGELAHLYKAGATYFVTWRLFDAVK